MKIMLPDNWWIKFSSFITGINRYDKEWVVGRDVSLILSVQCGWKQALTPVDSCVSRVEFTLAHLSWILHVWAKQCKSNMLLLKLVFISQPWFARTTQVQTQTWAMFTRRCKRLSQEIQAVFIRSANAKASNVHTWRKCKWKRYSQDVIQMPTETITSLKMFTWNVNANDHT